MTTKIDFANLSLKDALDLAILIEEEAKDRYAEFVDQMVLHHTPDAAEFFRTMIGNEARHEAELSVRRRSLFENAPRLVKRSMLWDVEAPDYDQTRAFMSARQAMGVALQSEIKAHDFFESALPHIKDPEVRTLFEELRQEELQHQVMVRRELEKLPPDSGIDPEAFVDEPTAQ
ncbi:MAG: ferritin family protein [Acidobacteriia bacterium]|nr:ferritin family protein [Terriglobia bacterium]